MDGFKGMKRQRAVKECESKENEFLLIDFLQIKNIIDELKQNIKTMDLIKFNFISTKMFINPTFHLKYPSNPISKVIVESIQTKKKINELEINLDEIWDKINVDRNCIKKPLFDVRRCSIYNIESIWISIPILLKMDLLIPNCKFRWRAIEVLYAKYKNNKKKYDEIFKMKYDLEQVKSKVFQREMFSNALNHNKHPGRNQNLNKKLEFQKTQNKRYIYYTYELVHRMEIMLNQIREQQNEICQAIRILE